MVYISAVADNSTSLVEETTESVNGDADYCQGLKKNYFRNPLLPIFTYHPQVIFKKIYSLKNLLFQEEEIPACMKD